MTKWKYFDVKYKRTLYWHTWILTLFYFLLIVHAANTWSIWMEILVDIIWFLPWAKSCNFIQEKFEQQLLHYMQGYVIDIVYMGWFDMDMLLLEILTILLVGRKWPKWFGIKRYSPARCFCSFTLCSSELNRTGKDGIASSAQDIFKHFFYKMYKKQTNIHSVLVG